MKISPNTDKLIEKILDSAPEEMDLTDEIHAGLVSEAADQILELGIDLSEIAKLEKKYLNDSHGDLVFILLVLKIVRSKILVQKIKDPLSVSVIFAVYKEHNRIKKKNEHPHGENFLVKKVEQLRWLFSENENIKWELIVVDDGCPEASGKIAQEIAKNEKLTEEVRVLFLADAIEKNIGPIRTPDLNQ